MAAKFCTYNLNELVQLVNFQEEFMVTFCVLNLTFFFVASLGNLLVIRVLWKASSIPHAVRKLFLNLAISDLAAGMFSQPTFGVIIAVMLKMASTGDYKLESFCPTILNVFNFFFFSLPCASFLNVTVIAVDRHLAILLHLRYHELVTSQRVIIALVFVWLISAVLASMPMYISLPKGNDLLTASIGFVGVLLTTVAYIRIYKVVRYHRNQIQSQLKVHNFQAVELLRQKKSAYNAVIVYIVFLGCYLPLFISLIFLISDDLQISYFAARHASQFLVLLNSSLNPLIYVWRYREIRATVKITVKKIFCMDEQET